jgi:phosphorylated CTD-interacting factor 1
MLLLNNRNATAEARKLVKWKVEETFSWLRSTSGLGASFEAFQERLVHLKVTLQPHVHIAAKSSVEGICKKMSVLSKQYASSVRESHLKLFVDPDSVKQDTKPVRVVFYVHKSICQY